MIYAGKVATVICGNTCLRVVIDGELREVAVRLLAQPGPPCLALAGTDAALFPQLVTAVISSAASTSQSKPAHPDTADTVIPRKQTIRP